ncbi:hypothetical protein E4T44_01926 [Aureobasidium sp. EXF-8845]|nr:hypothetical protein E4T44_01926 [Aureobasidium sp. EXF-8845]KAI4856862.1 hypothetical protein E4T45_01662 [Aureobasidium sp. EXF-8846]
MFFFGLGGLFYGKILCDSMGAHPKLTVGWGSVQQEPAFGGPADNTSVKSKVINLIASVRTLMRIPLILINTLIILYELILG